jgi:pullulanase/glycogen debranching enzyme
VRPPARGANAVASLLAVSLVAVVARADAIPTGCDAGAFETVLVRSALPPSFAHAQALFVDARRIRWPGATPGDDYVLYHSARGALRRDVSGRIRGADARAVLVSSSTPPGPDGAARLRGVGAGVDLELAPSDAARLREWLRGELLLVRERAGRALDATALQPAGALDALYATAARTLPLGATVTDGTPAATRFRLWAPTARRVELCVYSDASGRAVERHALVREPDTGTWQAALPGDRRGAYYVYLVDVWVRGTGLVRNRVTDPYSLALAADSTRSAVVRLDDPRTMPPGWDQAPRPAPAAADTDQVIYELHVRDFSRDDATVPARWRGKYLAFTSDSDGMRHLRSLAAAGLTDVHLMPVFDFSSVPERGCVTPAITGGAADEGPQARVRATAARDCFNWGYDPLHFAAPEGSYATDPGDALGRVREFRAMVQALHAAGLRVGMDVVYNHTVAAGRDPRAVLDRIVPDYYHRLDADGGVARSTCCANTATEHAMMERLMIDSAAVWARDYRIDAFRFDLMGHQPRAAMERLQRDVAAAAGRPIRLLGEGWDFGEVADGARFVQAAQGRLAGTGIATFNDRLRDAVRGGSPGDHGDALGSPGFATGLVERSADDAASRTALADATALVRLGLAGTPTDRVVRPDTGVPAGLKYGGRPAGYAESPDEVVNYVENHDNHTLYDAAVLKLPPGTPAAEQARVQIVALATVAFAQGIAYFHAGGELLRSKSLDRNSFDSGDWFNRVDWRGATNFFPAGLPPAPDNAADWPWLRPHLLDPTAVPTPADLDWTRRAFRDLLRIRASSTLFRLSSAAEVGRRLTFPDGGAPGIVVARLDGRGLDGAGYEQIVYAINPAAAARTVAVPALAGQPLELHPVHATGADARARDARWEPASATFVIPGRTAVVFVSGRPAR